jgi:hypothetical protein
MSLTWSRDLSGRVALVIHDTLPPAIIARTLLGSALASPSLWCWHRPDGTAVAGFLVVSAVATSVSSLLWGNMTRASHIAMATVLSCARSALHLRMAVRCHQTAATLAVAAGSSPSTDASQEMPRPYTPGGDAARVTATGLCSHVHPDRRDHHRRFAHRASL